MYFNQDARDWTCSETFDPDILPFHRTLPHYAATPLRRLPKFVCDELEVSEVLVKDESNRFRLPAFKILGASWASYKRIAHLLGLGSVANSEDLEPFCMTAGNAGLCLYTATDGNHGRAVARTADIFGVSCVVFVPRVMHDTTKDLIRQEGASLVVVDGDYDEAVREAGRECKLKGGLLIQDTSWPGYEEVPKVSSSPLQSHCNS